MGGLIDETHLESSVEPRERGNPRRSTVLATRNPIVTLSDDLGGNPGTREVPEQGITRPEPTQDFENTTPAPSKARIEELRARIEQRLRELREKPKELPPNPVAIPYGLCALKKAAKPVCFQYLADQAMKAFTTPVLCKTKLFGGEYFSEQDKILNNSLKKLQ